jgi:Flp pilus assembly protein TadD
MTRHFPIALAAVFLSVSACGGSDEQQEAAPGAVEAYIARMEREEARTKAMTEAAAKTRDAVVIREAEAGLENEAGIAVNSASAEQP